MFLKYVKAYYVMQVMPSQMKLNVRNFLKFDTTARKLIVTAVEKKPLDLRWIMLRAGSISPYEGLILHPFTRFLHELSDPLIQLTVFLLLLSRLAASGEVFLVTK